jgi:hypothetical protein
MHAQASILEISIPKQCDDFYVRGNRSALAGESCSQNLQTPYRCWQQILEQTHSCDPYIKKTIACVCCMHFLDKSTHVTLT